MNGPMAWSMPMIREWRWHKPMMARDADGLVHAVLRSGPQHYLPICAQKGHLMDLIHESHWTTDKPTCFDCLAEGA